MKCTFLNLYVASPALAGALSLACPGQAVAQASPQREVFFGQTHVHTSWSFDAYVIGNTLTGPEEAYQYATGEPIKHPAGHMVQITRPLDFQAVTDHSEYVGMMSLANDPTSPISKLPIAAKLRARTPAEVQATFQFLGGLDCQGRTHQGIDRSPRSPARSGHATTPDRRQVSTSRARSRPSAPTSGRRRRTIRTCTAMSSSRTAPRCPWLRSRAIDSDKAEDLWTWMDGQRKAGNEVLAISHNANLSDGLMFPSEVDGKGRPIDDAWAQERLHQRTADRDSSSSRARPKRTLSSRRPMSSPITRSWNYLIGIDQSSAKLHGSYVATRPTRMGSRCRTPAGYNPYKFGVVGAERLA